ncbi:immunity 26/phosphotriesterase HocA family protein [Effusibacillus pohliae]|uniref:immunity 26/phosphotriesterase HocA family protein n=1 Tax=Effusibacillus pohliae TaxID=232270 RepID=UPI00037798B3|nr:immunity 26/phosphotriesterase HocA family protein [Effusibacillus pohliae]
MEFDLLVKMQPSRKKPNPGDVFVVQPKNGLYFYGKVIKTNMPSKDLVILCNLIYIYKNPSQQVVMPTELNPRELLIPPLIINNQGWIKGYFKTIGSMPVTNEDLAVNFGFKDFLTKQFVDELGNPLGYEPELWTDYGLGSYGVVADKIHKILKEDQNL